MLRVVIWGRWYGGHSSSASASSHSFSSRRSTHTPTHLHTSVGVGEEEEKAMEESKTVLKEMLEAGPDLYAQNEKNDKKSALIYALNYRCPELVPELLDVDTHSHTHTHKEPLDPPLRSEAGY